jgi:hypothetical protein
MKNKVIIFEPVYCIKSFSPSTWYNTHFLKGSIYTQTSVCDDSVDGKWVFIHVNEKDGYKFSLTKDHRYLISFSKYFITMKELRKQKLEKLTSS